MYPRLSATLGCAVPLVRRRVASGGTKSMAAPPRQRGDNYLTASSPRQCGVHNLAVEVIGCTAPSVRRHVHCLNPAASPSSVWRDQKSRLHHEIGCTAPLER